MDSSQESSDDLNKLFVGGLGWNTSKEQVQEYFERFGPVSDVIVLRNPSTGQSRGFGFVTFASHESAQNAGNMKSGHIIDGKEVDVKPYSSKIHEMKRRQKFDNSMKIFVGGIAPSMKDEEIIEAFKKFGPVVDFTNMMDETRTRSRGFGFLTFEKPESIQRALSEHWVTINGKQLEVKPAQFNAKRNSQQTDMNAYNPYNANPMGGYAAMPPYMPYFDPYAAGVVPPAVPTGMEGDDYYDNPWSMAAAAAAAWTPEAYQQPRWQQRQQYPGENMAGLRRPGGRMAPRTPQQAPYKRPRMEYPGPMGGYGGSQVGADPSRFPRPYADYSGYSAAADPNAPPGMMMAPAADGMMDECYAAEEDPYGMYQRQGRYQAPIPPHPSAAGAVPPVQGAPRYTQPNAASYRYPTSNGGR